MLAVINLVSTECCRQQGAAAMPAGRKGKAAGLGSVWNKEEPSGALQSSVRVSVHQQGSLLSLLCVQLLAHCRTWW